jgi:hypothetical protein
VSIVAGFWFSSTLARKNRSVHWTDLPATHSSPGEFGVNYKKTEAKETYGLVTFFSDFPWL